MPDKWITTTPSTGEGKHILLGEGGVIKGGSVPKSAQGKHIRKWASELSNSHIKEAPRNIQRREGETEEEYQKRARKERAVMRKAEREKTPPPEPTTTAKPPEHTNTDPKQRKPGETDEEYKKRRQKERREARAKLTKELKTINESSNSSNNTTNIEGIEQEYGESIGKMINKAKNTLDNARTTYIDNIKNIHGFLEKSGVKVGGKLSDKVKVEAKDPDHKLLITHRLQKALDYLPSHWVEAFNKSGYKVKHIDGNRASCNTLIKEIRVNEAVSPETIAHEIAHIMEENIKSKGGTLGKLNVDFIKSRKSPGERAKPLGPPYRPGEKSVFDKFVDPYIGKIYEPYNSTEVLSMGMTTLYTKERFNKALQEDPDFIKHIIKMMMVGVKK